MSFNDLSVDIANARGLYLKSKSMPLNRNLILFTMNPTGRRVKVCSL